MRRILPRIKKVFRSLFNSRNFAIRQRNRLKGIPFVSFEGSAKSCGQEYCQYVLTHYPKYDIYLKKTAAILDMSAEESALFSGPSSFILEVARGIKETLGGPSNSYTLTRSNEEDECTSFSVEPDLSNENAAISGQNKDTNRSSEDLYIVLRMRITNGPTILILTYPGEIVGYGLWSTGTTLFRNSLHSKGSSATGIDMWRFALLAFSKTNIHEIIQIAETHGIKGQGNFLITDKSGASACFEFNNGGTNIILPTKGISVHANHPVGPTTAPEEHYPNKIEQDNSRFRSDFLFNFLDATRGALTVQNVYAALSNHTRFPLGICRHTINNSKNRGTTASVIAEPSKGLIHVSVGNPCLSHPETFSF
jgi:isopenicillin-N N-acyltransferase-like protein